MWLQVTHKVKVAHQGEGQIDVTSKGGTFTRVVCICLKCALVHCKITLKVSPILLPFYPTLKNRWRCYSRPPCRSAQRAPPGSRLATGTGWTRFRFRDARSGSAWASTRTGSTPRMQKPLPADKNTSRDDFLHNM